MKEVIEVQPEEPRDIGLALSLQINRCYRVLKEKRETLEEAENEGLALYGELGLTAIENELRKAGIALLWNNEKDMYKALLALREVK